MEKPEFSCAILSKLNLDDIEKVVKEAYHHKDDPGRPPRKPLGIFKALIGQLAMASFSIPLTFQQATQSAS